MRNHLVKRLQLGHSDTLKISSSQDHKRAKKVLELAKSLNRPVKFLGKGISTEWEKLQKKINNKKY